MEYKNILLFSLVLSLFLMPMISAKGMLDLEPAQISKTQILDKEYIVKSSGTYFKDLKQDNPIVWIDKRKGTTYHVDSTKTFNKEENESVTLEFFYDIQPDYIAHYTHSGKFDRYYFPTQWEWESNCEGEVCDGGWVTIEVQNIEKGTGSSTFPIGITGPTWANDGQFFGEFDGDSSFVEIEESNEITFNGTGLTNGYSISAWINPSSIGETNGRILDKSSGTSAQNGFEFEMGATNTIRFRMNFGSFVNSANNAVPFNEWKQILVTVSSSQIANIYIDGVQSGTADIDLVQTISSITTTNNPRIGTRSTGTDRVFDGSIDEVLFYNKTLDSTEALTLFNQYTLTSLGPQRTGTPSTTGLVLDINFDDFSVADNSGQGNHGTNTNVSFGEVFSIKRLLVQDTDYNISGSTFTLIDNNLQFMGIDTSWVYKVQTDSGAASLATANAFLTYPALVGLVGTIVLLGLVIAILVGSFVFGGKRGV